MVTLRTALYAIVASLAVLGAVSCDSQTTPAGAGQSQSQSAENPQDQGGTGTSNTQQ